MAEMPTRTQTHMSNPDPLRCDAYHEAGHAVVGIIRGLKLKIATVRPADGSDLQCRWDCSHIDKMLKSEQRLRRVFTKCFAEMSLASRYSEAMSCDTTSDEQRDAHHGDYIDAQFMLRRANLEYFSLATVSALKRRARTSVKQCATAIMTVVEKLLVCEGLDQVEIERIIKENPPIDNMTIWRAGNDDARMSAPL
jgi:hypothetical protein